MYSSFSHLPGQFFTMEGFTTEAAITVYQVLSGAISSAPEEFPWLTSIKVSTADQEVHASQRTISRIEKDRIKIDDSASVLNLRMASYIDMWRRNKVSALLQTGHSVLASVSLDTIFPYFGEEGTVGNMQEKLHEFWVYRSKLKAATGVYLGDTRLFNPHHYFYLQLTEDEALDYFSTTFKQNLDSDTESCVRSIVRKLDHKMAEIPDKCTIINGGTQLVPDMLDTLSVRLKEVLASCYQAA